MLSGLIIPAVALGIGVAAFLIDRLFNLDAKDIEKSDREADEVEARLRKLEREIADIRRQDSAKKPAQHTGPLASAH